MTPVRLEPAALRSRVKHSTTEPLRSPMVLLQRNLLFQGSRGDPTFSRGGGGCPTFFPRGGGVLMVIFIETHITCDFLGGSGPLPPPPLDLHIFLMALSLSDVCLGRYRNISSRLVPLNMFKPSSIFTGRTKAVLLLWIIFVIYVSCLSL